MAVVRGVVVADADTPDDTDLVDTEVTLKCRKEILLVLPAQWWLWWEHAQVSSYSYSIRDSRMIKILAYCELGTVTIMPSLSPNVVYHCDDVIWLDTAGACCHQIIAKSIGARGKSKDLDKSISLTVNLFSSAPRYPCIRWWFDILTVWDETIIIKTDMFWTSWV